MDCLSVWTIVCPAFRGKVLLNKTKSATYNPIVLTSLLVLLLTALPSRATPIKPTAEQLLQQQQQPVMPYIPAQAGWNGPATQSQADLEGFNTEEILRNAELARQHRAILMQVAIPDPRVLLAFALIILLLRKLRALREAGSIPAPQPAKA